MFCKLASIALICKKLLSINRTSMNIALLGYGKMGKEIERCALERGHHIVLKINSQNAASTSAALLKSADVAIEFSRPELAVKNILSAFDAQIPVVVGTTGWYEKLNDVKHIATERNQSFLYASNFSVGVNLFFELNKQLAALMANHPEYAVQVQEIHHLEKLDAPSGTAISLTNDLLALLPGKNKWVNNVPASDAEIEIESLRQKDVPGTHTVGYNSSIDRIEIKHEAHNRKGFALGAVMAAEWIIGKKGVFEMKHVLGYH